MEVRDSALDAVAGADKGLVGAVDETNLEVSEGSEESAILSGEDISQVAPEEHLLSNETPERPDEDDIVGIRNELVIDSSEGERDRKEKGKEKGAIKEQTSPLSSRNEAWSPTKLISAGAKLLAGKDGEGNSRSKGKERESSRDNVDQEYGKHVGTRSISEKILRNPASTVDYKDREDREGRGRSQSTHGGRRMSLERRSLQGSGNRKSLRGDSGESALEIIAEIDIGEVPSALLYVRAEQILFTTGNGGHMYLHRVAADKEPELLQKIDLSPLIGVSLAYHPSRRHVAVGSSHGIVRVFSLNSDGDHATEILRIDSETQDPIIGVFYDILQDTIFAVSSMRTLVMMDYATKAKRLVQLQGMQVQCCSTAYDPKHYRLFLGDTAGIVSLHDFVGGCLGAVEQDQGSVRSLTYDVIHSTLVSGSFDNNMYLWRVGKAGSEQNSYLQSKISCHDGPVNAVAICPERQCVFAGSSDMSISCTSYEALLGDEEREMSPTPQTTQYIHTSVTKDAHETGLRYIHSMSGCAAIASSSNDGIVKIWRITLHEVENEMAEIDDFSDLAKKNSLKKVLPPPNVPHLLWLDLLAAASAGASSKVESILQKKVVKIHQPNQHGDTVLHLAVISQDLPTISCLLRYGARPGARNKKFQLPLHFARKLFVAKALVEDELRESDPQRYIDSVDSEGRTLLHYLVAEENAFNAKMCSFVLDNSVTSISIADKKGYTPLLLAACNNSRAVPFLIKYHADVKAVVPKTKDNALHLLAKHWLQSKGTVEEHMAAVKALVLAGCDPDVPNLLGHSASVLAQKENLSHFCAATQDALYEAKMRGPSSSGSENLVYRQLAKK